MRWFRRESKLRKEWIKRLEDEGTSPQEAPKFADMCIERGLPIDFELPYPEPRNEYEDAWNDINVNPVVSGRADWE